jgi:methionyl-tRNA synthetase
MDEIRQAPVRIGEYFENLRLREALLSIVEIARNGNQYMSSREPWHLIKTNEKKAATTIYVALQLVYALAILLEPFIPHVSEKILSQLGLEIGTAAGMWDKVGVNLIHSGDKIGKPAPLFRKVDARDIRRRVHQPS